MSELGDYLEQSIDGLIALKRHDLAERMEAAVAAIAAALVAGRPMLVCGNGGSAADAQHIAGELVGRFLKERKGYNVLALGTDTAVVTAWSNDYSFDSLFARQVEAHGGPGAVLLAISTSGNSKNVVAAAEAARGLGMTVVALTGEGGGLLAALADILLDVPSRFTPVIQQGHLCLYHFLCKAVEERLTAAV